MYLGVGVRFHNLADDSGRFIYPCPTTHSLVRCWTQRVGERGVSALNTGHVEGVVCADNVLSRAFAGRWINRNRPGGHEPDSGVPRHLCGQKSPGGAVGVCPSGPRWAPNSSPT